MTGLVDAEQDTRYKVSMYAKAQQLGLPSFFVDVRHESAHGEIPSLQNLRTAAAHALSWLWDHYWKDQQSSPEDAQRRWDHLKGERRGASQSGIWTQWTGPWCEKPIGVVP